MNKQCHYCQKYGKLSCFLYYISHVFQIWWEKIFLSGDVSYFIYMSYLFSVFFNNKTFSCGWKRESVLRVLRKTWRLVQVFGISGECTLLVPGRILFFSGEIRNQKIFTCKQHVRLYFIYWTRQKWQKVNSFFWLYCFNSQLSYHSYQWVCKFLFLITTFVKMSSNLMCGSS